MTGIAAPSHSSDLQQPAPDAAASRRRPRAEWLDRLLTHDPGLNRLRMALQVVVSIGAALLAERLFVRLTGALQAPTTGLSGAPLAQVTAANHAMLVIAMMIGAMVCMMATFAAPMLPTVRTLYLAILLMPVPMVAGLAIGLATSHHRPLALTLLTLILAGGAYLRRFGPWGFFGGQLMFMGDFMGFFLGEEVGFATLKWFAPEVVLGHWSPLSPSSHCSIPVAGARSHGSAGPSAVVRARWSTRRWRCWTIPRTAGPSNACSVARNGSTRPR